MNFIKVISDLFSKPSSTPNYTLLSQLMANAGMPTDFGSATRENPRLTTSGTPACVLAGCKKEAVVIPGTERPAFSKEGKPIMGVMKGGKHRYQVMDSIGIDRKQWKALVNDQKRKAHGRHVGPFGFPTKAA